MDLYVSDLDGTLLDRDARLPAAVRDRLNALIDQGLPFTVASARSVFSMGSILEGLRLRLPIVEFNGGCVTRLDTREPLLAFTIERPLAEAIGAAGVTGGVSPLYSTHEGGKQWVYVAEGGLNPGEQWYRDDRAKAGDPRLRPALPQGRLPAGRVLTITFIGREVELLPIQAAVERLDPTLQMHLFPNHYSPGWHWLSVHPGEATKGNAVRWLAEREGIAMDRVTVFGDALNDLSMFRAAGHGVAVANAHPDLKAVADEEIGSHEDGSVLNYLERRRSD